MIVKPLPNETAAKTGFTHLIIIQHGDLTETTANTAQTIELLDVVAGDVVRLAADYLKTPFSDASDGAFNTNLITIGDGGSAGRFIASQELNVNGTEVLYKTQANTTPYVYTTADTIDLVVGSMTAKSLSNIDGGELHIYLGITRLSSLEALLSNY